MEVVGVAASIVALVQLTGKVASMGYSYTTSAKRAPKDVQELINELHSLSTVLDSLQDYVDANPQFLTLQKQGVVDGPLSECTNELEELRCQLEATDPSGFYANLKLRSLSQEIKYCVEKTDLTIRHIKSDVQDTTLAIHEVKESNHDIQRNAQNTNMTVHAIKAGVQNIDMAAQNLQNGKSD